MPEGDKLYSKNLFLLALKGRIIVHFMDGSTLEGDYAAQDELNIFLAVGEGPVMIPRSQVKFIQGKYSQPIEPDSFQPVLPAAEPIPTPTALADTVIREPVEVPPATFQEFVGVSPTPEEEEEEEDAGTLILKPEPEVYRSPTIENEPAPESYETAFVLDEPALTEIPATPGSDMPAENPLLEEDDATYIFAQQEDKPNQVKVRLVCTSGPHTGETFQLTGGLVTIGRSTDSTFALNKDKEISRRHAIIVQEGTSFFIQDQNSLNGTFVNNELIKGSYYLKDGDVILVGLSTLEYHEE